MLEVCECFNIDGINIVSSVLGSNELHHSLRKHHEASDGGSHWRLAVVERGLLNDNDKAVMNTMSAGNGKQCSQL